MASPAFRSMVAATGGAGDTVSFTPPSGLANNDILIGVIYCETNAQAITPPTGFASFKRISSTNFAAELFWKRAASESGNYDFTETGNDWGDGTLYAVSGCITTETPIGVVGASNTGTDITAEANGITPSTNNSLLNYIAVNFDSQNMNLVPGGMTERFDNDNEYLSTQDIATAGTPTGTLTGTWDLAQEWLTVLFELKSESSGSAPTAAQTLPAVTQVQVSGDWVGRIVR